MDVKVLTRRQWRGADLDSSGKALAPSVAPSVARHLEGLNQGELYICDNVEDPCIFIRTTADTVVRIGGADLDDLKSKFLSKVEDDTAKGVITFEGGMIVKANADFGTFVQGILNGKGARITKAGSAEFEDVTIRTSLTVPEIRYNRASLVVGTDIQSPCGGVIASVNKTSDTTGVCTLELGDDEMYGSIQEGALCWGYWHDMGTPSNNATANADDHQGNITYKGFATVYFQISKINNANSTEFTYKLREGTSIHPYAGMNFGGRGNSNTDESYDKFRSFTIKTPYYEASYDLVSSWDWSDPTEGVGKYLTRVSGRLDGFESVAGLTSWPSYPYFGTIDCNFWLRGGIHQIEKNKQYIYITQPSNGMLLSGETETVSFKIRNNYFEDITKDYTISVNGTALPVGDNPTIDISYSSLTEDKTTFTVTATSTTYDAISSSFTERRLTLDYHLDIYKAALDAGNETDVDIEFNDGTAVQFQDGANIASVEAGDSIAARRMIRTAESTLGAMTYQLDSGNEIELANNEVISIASSSNTKNIIFRWYYNADHTVLVTSRSIPVIRVNSAWMIYHDGTDTPTKPIVGEDISVKGWYQGQTSSTIWMSQKSSPALLEGEWGEPIRLRGADGTSVNIKGHVADSSFLPETGNENDAYISDDNGHLWVWSSKDNAWFDAGQFKGDAGNNAYVHIKYSHDGTSFSEQSDPTDPTTVGETPAEWIGVYSDSNASDSTQFSAYKWKRIEGLNYVTGYAFYRAVAAPTTPEGGSFESPKPTTSGWSDGIPAATESNPATNPVWMSRRSFCSDSTKSESNWSTPVMMADTADFDVCYNTSTTKPNNPLYHHTTDQGNGWTNTSTEDAIWMATDKLINGTWQGWNVVKVKGEQGIAGEDAKVYELRIRNTVANTSIGFDDEFQFNDGETIEWNDGTEIGAVSEGDVIYASRWFNNELSDIGSLWVQKDSEEPVNIEDNAGYTVLRGTTKVTFTWCRTSEYSSDIIYQKLIPILNSGITVFTSFVFKRAIEQPDTPVGGTYSNPIPGTGGWTDGIPEADEGMPVWMSKKLFYSDYRVGEVWTTPKQMSDTGDFDVEFSLNDEYTAIPETVHGTDKDKSEWGWTNESSKNSIWMATSRMINGSWTKWQYSRIKGEDCYSVQIFTNTGNLRVEKGGTITLTAKVYKGGVDVTSKMSTTAFAWTRTSDNADSDAEWNARHTAERAVGNVITVGDADIYRRAQFSCDVTFDY